jgi:hypothetical protein
MTPILIGREILAVGRHLRRLLDNEAIYIVSSPSAGQPPQLRYGGAAIGTVDVDAKGDFIIHIEVRRYDLGE